MNINNTNKRKTNEIILYIIIYREYLDLYIEWKTQHHTYQN